jgi:DNA-binding protein HU-beta
LKDVLVNRSELVAAIAAKAGLDAAEANAALAAVIAAVAEALAAGEKVTIPGFGTFETRHRDARTGRNPQTGETMQIAASTAPAFKPGAGLKDAVNK